MRLAYTMAPGRGDTDALLHEVAQRLMAAGHRICGTTQINTDRLDAGRCDMDVLVLPAGPKVRISQSLGPGARGCRLDAAALETAVGLVHQRLPQSTGLIVNKFGKHEAEGRGFRDVIADAMALDLPVLVGLNALNERAFLAFSGGLAEALPPTIDDLATWLDLQLNGRTRAA